MNKKKKHFTYSYSFISSLVIMPPKSCMSLTKLSVSVPLYSTEASESLINSRVSASFSRLYLSPSFHTLFVFLLIKISLKKYTSKERINTKAAALGSPTLLIKRDADGHNSKFVLCSSDYQKLFAKIHRNIRFQLLSQFSLCTVSQRFPHQKFV